MITIIIHYPKNTFIDDKRARRERETHIAEAPRRNTRTIIQKHTHIHMMNTYWRDADEGKGLRHHLRRCCCESESGSYLEGQGVLDKR